MLTVLNVAFPFAEVGAHAVGGAEQVVSALDVALTRAGHRSLVLGQAGSRVQGELVGVNVGRDLIDTPLRQEIAERYRRILVELVGRYDIDLLHFHGVDCADYIPGAGPPRLVTLHLAHGAYAPALFRPERDLLFTCVSEAQRAELPAGLPVAACIDNGVDLAYFQPNPGAAGAYVLCLGRICPEKGFDVALRAAAAAGVALRLAGRVFPYTDHRDYFSQQIQPLLDEQRCLTGAVAGEAKRRLLSNAACLVVPSRVAETSSLVVMEALASGTPVIVSDQGALPSLIEEGLTGYVATGEAPLAEALRRRRRLDRGACRASATARFDLSRTTARYLELYERIARSSSRRSSGLRTGAPQ